MKKIMRFLFGSLGFLALVVWLVLPNHIGHSQDISAGGGAIMVTNNLNTGVGSLRQAILDANNNAGPDVIQFAIGTGSVQINIDSALPTINEALVIDGTSQPGFSGTPLIIVNRNTAPTSANGLRISGGGSTIKGLALLRFANGIMLETAGNNVVTGCFVGLDPSNEALTTTGNALNGILITNSPNNRIGGTTAAERNVIAQNGDGVEISGSTSTGNVIVGNYIGLRSNGTDAARNLSSGVLIDGAPGNRVGGSAAGERNIISGHQFGGNAGVFIKGSAATANLVQGNSIGTDVTGLLERGNNDGVRIEDAPNNTVGGTTGTTPGGACTGVCNLISGNRANGVIITNVFGTTASDNVVEGNFFNLNPSGTAVVSATTANQSVAISNSPNNRVGGSTAAARNVIANGGPNGNNVAITGNTSTNNTVTGNYMGTDTTGAALGNAQAGVFIQSVPVSNRIGGTTAGERNVIAGGNQLGVFLGTGNMNVVQGNYIGTDATGTVDLGNTLDGVRIQGGTNSVVGTATGTTLGGACTGGCNLISGNNRDGVSITNFASVGNRVDYNYIGLNAAGTAAIRNTVNAVNLFGTQNNIIGKPLPASGKTESNDDDVTLVQLCVQSDRTGNFISYNDGTGDFTYRDCRRDVTVTGSGAVSQDGFSLYNRNPNIAVTVDPKGHGSVVGIINGKEVVLFDSFVNEFCTCPTAGLQTIVGEVKLGTDAANAANNTLVNGNSLGLDAKGTEVLSSPSEVDLRIQHGFLNQYFNNEFAALDGPAVTIANGTNNELDGLDPGGFILYPNEQGFGADFLGVAVDLNNNGIRDPNDPQDPDGGANNTQNYPDDLKVVRVTDGGIKVTGTLNSVPNASFRVNLHTIYVSPPRPPSTVGTVSSYGVALQTPLQISADGNGNTVINITVNGVDAAEIKPGDYLSANATVITPAANAGDTSEFSVPVKIHKGNIDFDNDGKTDIATFRSGPPADWYVLNSSDNSVRIEQFGVAGDKPVAGDYQGDGIADLATWRPLNGTWFNSGLTGNPATNFDAIPFGISTDIPVRGDYDGDNVVDQAVFRPSEGNWYIRNGDGSFSVQNFGLATDKLVPADYNGDGRTDVAVYRNGTWYISVCPTCPVRYEQFGLAGDIPVPADYDGDGRDDVAVFRPGTGVWYLLQSTAGFRAFQWGVSTDIPINGDFDADGKNDIAIWRPSTGDWWVIKSSDGSSYVVHWGQNGDVPVPAFPNAP